MSGARVLGLRLGGFRVQGFLGWFSGGHKIFGLALFRVASFFTLALFEVNAKTVLHNAQKYMLYGFAASL